MPTSSRAFSPPLSTVSLATVGSGLVQRPVTKLAIEGRCRAEGDGASLRMFFKISIPTEGLVPGQAIPLFPEENVRIITSKVHPLDANSAPYAFSTSNAPLLHRTARALNLPPRLAKSYYPVVGVPAPPPSPGESSSYRKNASQPLGVSLTGEINVSKFHVCFILPKVFPSRFGDLDSTGYMNAHGSQSRRNSIVDRNVMLFMAGVELFIPFQSKPPKSPFALSIPVPRCLHNTIKLRVPPPPRSFTADDPPPWDFTSEPFISNSRNRSNSYELLEDDEESLSDSQASSSSAGFSSSGVQGTFPSTDTIRIRWATPMSKHAGTGILADGRRRVVIDDVVGLTKCTILERDGTGMKVRLVYEAKCRGISFPGVAIQLAMDVVLNSKGREVTWLSEDDKWEVSGGKGFTGFDVGGGRPSQPTTPSRASLTPGRSALQRPTIQRSSLTTASLLRTPLPNLNNSDYSFEASQMPTPSMIPSDISSTVQSLHGAARSPTQPVTVHLNITNLDIPPHNEFTIRIAGTVFVSTSVSPTSPQRYDTDDNVLSLPVFHIPAAERERTEVAVSSETMEGLQLVMPDPSGKTPPRRRLLRKRSEVKTEEGVGVLFSPSPSPRSTTSSVPQTPEMKLLASNHSTPTRRNHGARSSINLSSIPVTGPAFLPTVQVTLTPLPNSSKHSHAVRLSLPLPYSNVSAADSTQDAKSSPFQFGVLLPVSLIARGNEQLPTVTLVSSTISGIAVRGEVYPRVPDSSGGQSSPLRGAFGEPDDENPPSPNQPTQLGRDFVCWIQVHIEDEGVEEVSTVGVPLEVVYLVGKLSTEDEPQPPQPNSPKPRIKPPFKIDAYLPCFLLDVGQLVIHVETPLNYESPTMISTNLHQHQPFKLTNYSLPPYFTPRLTFTVQAIPKGPKPALGTTEQQTLWTAVRSVSHILPFLILYLLWTVSMEVRELRAITDDIASVSGIGSWSVNEGARWQLGNDGGANTQSKITTIVSETLTLTVPDRTTLVAPGAITPTPTSTPTTSVAIDVPPHPFFKSLTDIQFVPSEITAPLRNLVNVILTGDLDAVSNAGLLVLSKVLAALRWMMSYPLPP